MRINKYLAESGIASRRASDSLIKDGIVKINGKIANLGDEVDIGDSVTVNGKKVNANTKYEYYVMNKPKGYICSVKDDKGRKTVIDLLPKNMRLFPVGRLDYNTEGLLILTNDGGLTYKLTHPKNEVPKTYLVKTERKIKEDDVAKLRNGVIIDGVKTKKCNIKLLDGKNYEGSKLQITITEGRNRQIRKMVETIGNSVNFLKRIKIGDLVLSGLNRGEYRKLSDKEIDYLLNL